MVRSPVSSTQRSRSDSSSAPPFIAIKYFWGSIRRAVHLRCLAAHPRAVSCHPAFAAIVGARAAPHLTVACPAARVPGVRRNVWVGCCAANRTPWCPPGACCFCAAPSSSSFTPRHPMFCVEKASRSTLVDVRSYAQIGITIVLTNTVWVCLWTER
eukprot:XP_023158028.1 uncharacterized protein LOC111591302 [Zea mays]